MADETRRGEVELSRKRVPVICRMRLGFGGLHSEETTKGYEFEIDGLKFVVHRCLRSPSLWAVTEPRTGLAVIQDWHTRRKAIWRAEQIVAEKGGAKAVEKAMRKNARRHGFEISKAAS